MKIVILLTLSLLGSAVFAANANEDPVTAKMRDRFIEGEVPSQNDFKLNHGYRCYIHSATSKPYPADEFSIVFTSRVEGVNGETCLFKDFNSADLSCAQSKNRDFELAPSPEGWVGVYQAASPTQIGNKFIFRKDNESHFIFEGVVYHYGNKPTGHFGPNGIERSIAMPDFTAVAYGACH